jgi:hypothetical protein
MSADPGVVFLAGLVTSSPALWRLTEGELTVDETLLRCGLAFGICWLAIAIVSALAFPGPAAPKGPETERTDAPLAGPPLDEVAPVE